jgi:hypothetical protein
MWHCVCVCARAWLLLDRMFRRRITTIMKVERISELGTLAVTSNSILYENLLWDNSAILGMEDIFKPTVGNGSLLKYNDESCVRIRKSWH